MTARPVGLAIVGLGRWANVHAEAARRSQQVRLVSCYSRSEATRRDFCERHGVPGMASSYAELLADPAVEAIIVATPNDLHLELTLQALAAGKSVLVDKPLAPDVTDGLELLRAQPAGGAQIAVAHNMRRLSAIRATKQWVDSGASGPIRLAHASACNGNARNVTAQSWRATGKGADGGVLVQVGVHVIDNLLYLLGPARAVSAFAAYPDSGPQVASAVTLIIEHSSGALSNVQTSWTTAPHFRIDLLGGSGSMHFVLDYAAWQTPRADRCNELIARGLDGGQISAPVQTFGDPLMDQLDDLASIVRSGSRPEIGALEGLRAVAVVEAATTSAASGGSAVTVDQVLRDAGANDHETALVLGPVE